MESQAVTYAELSIVKNSKRKQLNPQVTKRVSSVPESEVNYVELNFQNASRDLQWSDKHCQCKGFQSIPEKFLVGMLGIACLVLTSTVLTLIIAFPESKFWESSTTMWKQTNNSSVSRATEAYHLACCPEEWLAYSGNCYHYSSEAKPWNESVKACASINSHLLYIDSEEEMKFLISIASISWTGISRESSVHPWTPIYGSMPKVMIKGQNIIDNNCLVLHSSGPVAEACGFINTYICKDNARRKNCI